MDQTTYMIVAGLIFVIAYIAIITDKIDRTLVALAGACAMVVASVISQENAFLAVDWNTILLLVSMMIMVMVIRRSGLFEYIAVKTIKIAKGDPIRILILISIITGILSAFLDNVTCIIIMIPIILSLAKDLNINPIPFILADVFASNVGGTATLIGDPPNIMIGSKAGLNFNDFVQNETLICAIILVVTTLLFAYIFRKKLKTTEECKAIVMQLNEKECIKDKKLVIKSIVVFVLVVVGFVLQSVFHYQTCTVAIVGAVVLLLISKIKPKKIVMEVEWNTILFFCGLFVMVGGLQAAGIIELMAKSVVTLTNGNMNIAILMILWMSAIASAFIDNIPFTATMIPLIKSFGTLAGASVGPLWWALSLGACLGGNGTIIGASANVVASGMSEDAGHKISFKYYFKYAFPVMLVTIVISTVYLIIFYFK